MSEQSSAIESEVLELQQLRSATETTLDKPNNSDDVAVVKSNDATEEIKNTIDDKMYVKTPTDKEKAANYSKPSDTEEKVNLTSEKAPDITNLAYEESAVAGKDDFVYSPVITVTKEESTLTKGDLKLQKVVVSEDISEESAIRNGAVRVAEACSPTKVRTDIQREALVVSLRTDKRTGGLNDTQKTEEECQKKSKKTQTKIPKLKFKQVVERIRKEKQEKVNTKDAEPSSEQKRRSSIPRLKDIKNPPLDIQREITPIKKYQELESPKVDDEFNKIYEEIIEIEASNNVPSLEKISNPIKLESKFEEIIHAYDDNNVQPISTEKIKSKIPLLKRKSEQEIEIPPTSHRKYSFKRSNTEDYKNKTPVTTADENSSKSNVDLTKHENNSTPKTNNTNSGAKKEVIPKNKTDLLGSTTIVKTINIYKSTETKVLNNISPMETLENLEKTNNVCEKDSTKCKIPVALNAREDFEMKINSAILNKHPTRINITTKISGTDQKDKVKDENFEKSQSRHVINVDTSAVLKEKENLIKQNDKHNILETKNIIVKKVITEIAKNEIESLENLSSLQSRPSDIDIMDAYKPINEAFETNNKPICHKTESENSNLIAECSKSRTDTPDNVKPPTDQNKMLYVPLSDNQIENNNIDKNTVKIKENKGDSTVIEPSASHTQQLKNVHVNNQVEDKDPKNFKQDDKINNEAKENKIGKEIDQTFDKIELTLESPIRTIMIENNTITENISNTQNRTTPQIIPEKVTLIRQNQSDDKPINTCDIKAILKEPAVCESRNIENNHVPLLLERNQIDIFSENVSNVQTVLEKENLEESNNKLADLPEKNSSIEEKAEEDIIMLKGKVNRVIKRLDSKDNKTVKKEPDDLPKAVSVISKIAIFERTESKDLVSKNSKSTENIGSLKQDAINDKPKIVNEFLKMDINQNEVISAGESMNTTASENTSSGDRAIIRNDLEIKKVKKTENTSDSITNRKGVKNILYDGKKINRVVSSGVNNEVFVKDDDKSSLEVWNEYRRRKEDSDMRRAKSLAELELELGDAAPGRVRQLVVRMSSVEWGAVGSAGSAGRGAGRERPRGGAVSQRIAMFEKKLTPAPPAPARQPPKHGTHTHTEASSIDEEGLRSRIEELKGARAQYGRLEEAGHVEFSDGGSMPVLALGTALLEPALLTHVIHAGIELGYRAIDCAYIYGNEREVGQAIRDKIQDGTVTRSELFIINKLWSTSHGRDRAALACRQSLHAMGLHYFDLYLIHNPMSFKEGSNPLPKIAGVLQYSTHDYLEAWFGVEDLISQGLVRRGGLSNFNSQQVDRVVEKARIKPVINQVECHPYLTQLRLEEFCSARNIKLSCFGVLGSKGTPAELTSGLPPVIDDPLVKVMAAGLGVTPAQLLISYQLQLGRSVVVKCSSARHLAQAGAPLRLEPHHVAALSALNRNKRMFTFKGMGDTHKNYPFRIPF